MATNGRVMQQKAGFSAENGGPNPIVAKKRCLYFNPAFKHSVLNVVRLLPKTDEDHRLFFCIFQKASKATIF